MRARALTVTLAMAATGAGAGAVAASGPAPEAEAARTVNVTVGDDFFRPARLSVRRGTRVLWRWRGRDEHNVTAISGPGATRSSARSDDADSGALSAPPHQR
jgi:plastocyanin